MHLTYLISVPQVIYWNVGFYIIKNILKSTVQNAWQEEVERARQGQRDAESKLSSLEAEVRKMRVEMAAMKRDAEHYSRQGKKFY
ncbi:golgin-84 isoform X4 [Gossypium hirsutum]|uniref:Golgin-84 isoform X4 n=1 Tax=Gossypium hirsutum TaxID=3635 RepID=A0ABM2ZZF0_GOSHI|nr:golgin-84 isoform X4 [Gossypium hirsutum]